MKNLKECIISESSKQKANIFIPLCGSLHMNIKEVDNAVENFKKLYKCDIYGFNNDDVMDYDSVYEMQKDAKGPHPSLDGLNEVIHDNFLGKLNIIYYF